jgi:hypothetical protein
MRRSQAHEQLTLDEARKAAMTNYAHSLAAAVKSNACSWEAGPAYKPIGPGDSPAATYSRCMYEGSHMSSALRRCLIGAGISTAAVAVGNVIAAAAARVIASQVVSQGAAACLTAIAL